MNTDLSALEALEKSVSSEPWHAEFQDSWGVKDAQGFWVADSIGCTGEGDPCVYMKFLAEIRNALPSLISELLESREALRVAESALDRYRAVEIDAGEALADIDCAIRKAKG